MGAKKFDWTAIKARWAASSLGLRAFAKQEGVHLSAATKHSAEDGWQQARADFRAQVAEEATAKRVSFRARSEAEIDNRMHTVSDHLTAEIQARIAISQKERLKPEVEQDKKKILSALDIKLLSEAMDNVYATQRTTAGLPAKKIPDTIHLEGELGIQTGVIELPLVEEG